MALFRKRPVTIEAFQLPPDADTPYLSTDWWASAMDAGTATVSADGFIIKTLEGDHLGRWGDWVIQGVQGELYPCKPDIFEATYEPARAQSWAARAAKLPD